MSDGHFDRRLEVARDELGQLAGRINAMTRNLGNYTSQLKQMVDENQSVKEYLESVINQTADAIHTTDTYERVISVNKAFEQLYGWKAHEVVGRKPALVPPAKEEEERNASAACGPENGFLQWRRSAFTKMEALLRSASAPRWCAMRTVRLPP